MESTREDAMKIGEITKDLDYDINLVEEAASGFERTDSNFARISTVGKMLSSSLACSREIISERKKSANLHGKVHGCLTKERAKVTPTSATTSLVSQQPSTLRQDSTPAKRL